MVTPPLPPFARTASPDPSLATPRPYLQGTAVPSRPAGSPAAPRPGIHRGPPSRAPPRARPSRRAFPSPPNPDSPAALTHGFHGVSPVPGSPAVPPFPGCRNAPRPGVARGSRSRSPPWFPAAVSPVASAPGLPRGPRPGLPPMLPPPHAAGLTRRPPSRTPTRPGLPACTVVTRSGLPRRGPVPGSPVAPPIGLPRGSPSRSPPWSNAPGSHVGARPG